LILVVVWVSGKVVLASALAVLAVVPHVGFFWQVVVAWAWVLPLGMELVVSWS